MADLGTRVLAGKCILVVEDDYLIAQDVCELLCEWGAEITGPVGRLKQALDLVQNATKLDFAVLDLNLNGEGSAEIARMLRSRKIGFVFVSGYDAGAIPEEFADAPRLVKPLESMQLRRAIEGGMAASGTL